MARRKPISISSSLFNMAPNMVNTNLVPSYNILDRIKFLGEQYNNDAYNTYNADYYNSLAKERDNQIQEYIIPVKEVALSGNAVKSKHIKYNGNRDTFVNDIYDSYYRAVRPGASSDEEASRQARFLAQKAAFETGYGKHIANTHNYGGHRTPKDGWLAFSSMDDFTTKDVALLDRKWGNWRTAKNETDFVNAITTNRGKGAYAPRREYQGYFGFTNETNNYLRKKYINGGRIMADNGMSISAGGYVKRRNPIGLNIAAYNEMINALDTKSQQQAQQQSAIDMALAQLPVNAAEDVWRMQLSDEIRQQIDSVENPNDRLLTSIKAAGQLMNRPDVIGRIRAQANYKNFVEQTQKRNDIDQRTKNWAIETNPYNYQDITDSTGRIVGGTDWKANTPVANVNLADIATKALSWVKPDSVTGSKTTFIDAENNPTDDISKAAFIGYITENGVINLGEDKLREAINAALKTTTGAMASMNQDYDIALWEYNKLTPEEKVSFGGNEVVDANGNIKSREDYIGNMFNGFVKAASYKNTTNTVTYDNTFTKYLASKATSAGTSVGPMSEGINDTGVGPSITYDLTDVYGSSQTAMVNALDRAESIYSPLSKSKHWQQLKANNNYDGMIKYLNDNIERLSKTSGQGEIIAGINNVIQQIKNNKDIINRVSEGLSKEDKDLVNFGLSYNSGTAFAQNNSVVRRLNTRLRDAFSDGNRIVNRYQIRFVDGDELNEVLQDLNISANDAEAHGINISVEDGRPVLTVNADNNNLYKILYSTQNHYDPIFHMPGKGTEIRSLDSNGNIIKRSDRGVGRTDFLSAGANTIDLAVRGKNSIAGALLDLNITISQTMPQAMRKINSIPGKITTTNQGTTMDDPVIARFRAQAGDDLDSQSKLKSAIDLRKKDVANELIGIDYTQTNIFGYDNNTNTLTKMNNVDRKALASRVAAYLNKGDERATYRYYSDGNMHGYLVTLSPTLDKDNKPTSDDMEYYFFPSAISNEAIDGFNGDSKFKAKKEYTQRRSTKSGYTTKFGKTYDIITNEGGFIGKQHYSQQEVESDIEIDKLIEQANGLYTRSLRSVNQQVANAQVQKDATIIAAYQGITPKSENDMEYATYIQYLINLIKTAQ